MGGLVRRLGGWLFYAGIAAFAGIFIIVMINGTWPALLYPVKALFATLNDWVGGFAIIVEGWLFLGPGLLLIWLGKAMERKEKEQR